MIKVIIGHFSFKTEQYELVCNLNEYQNFQTHSISFLFTFQSNIQQSIVLIFD